MKKAEERFNILFTSVGRRVSLVRHFQKTLQDLGLQGSIIGADVSEDSPAFHVVDKAYKICRIDSPQYIPTLLELCRKENVRLLFPLIDTDLLKLSESRQAFAGAGTNAVVSDPEVIKISMDKYKTHDFFASRGIGTPMAFDLHKALDTDIGYPLFMKPLDGSASKGIFKIRDKKELLFFKGYIENPILQEYLSGTEFTLDVLFDFTGKARCIVPRMRIEVRSGEVSKGAIIYNKQVVDEGWRVAGLLEGCRGCVNMQCFLTPEGKVKFVEINPRFGGGAPLSLHAGADFSKWIIMMAQGEDPGDVSDAYRKNVYMLRYDDAVFVEGSPYTDTGKSD